MLLSDSEIRPLLDDPNSGLVLRPFDAAHLHAAKYDLHVGSKILISGQEAETDLSIATTATLQPGDFAVVVTHEYFEVPSDIVLNIGAKTYLTKKGIILQAGMQIDPGFKGHLVLGLFNSSPRKYVVEHLGELCSVQFFKLRTKAVRPFSQRNELVRGEIPRMDKEYLYSLETKNLTSLGEDVRALTRNVGELTTSVGKVSDKVQENSLETRSIERSMRMLLAALVIGVVALAIQQWLNKPVIIQAPSLAPPQAQPTTHETK